MKKLLSALLLAAMLVAASPLNAEEPVYKTSDDSSDFVVITEVVPDVILEIRYYSTYNFVGARIDGYEEPVALFTREAA